MQEYNILKDFPGPQKIERKGGSIELSKKQARSLRIAGFIKPKVNKVATAPEKTQAKKAK